MCFCCAVSLNPPSFKEEPSGPRGPNCIIPMKINKFDLFGPRRGLFFFIMQGKEGIQVLHPYLDPDYTELVKGI